MTRRLRWAVALTALAVAAIAAATFAPQPDVPPGPEPGRSLYRVHCASCHGADARGRSWRATLLFLRPGDLTSGPRPEGYVREVIRQGGASFGKPGMPSFGFYLSEAEIEALVSYVRGLSSRATAPR